LDLCKTPFIKIYFQGHNGESLFLEFLYDPVQLFFLEKKLSVSQRRMVGITAKLIGRDMKALDV
jgi:hypothetical protein